MNRIELSALLDGDGFGTPTARIVQTLRERGGLSGTQIAKLTGLAKSTVSTALTELRRSSIVVESASETGRAGGAGRPATVLTLNPDAGTIVGAVMGFGYVQLILADVSHAIIANKVQAMDIDYSPEDALEVVQVLMRDAFRENELAPASLLGIGIAIAGPVNPVDSRVSRASIVPTWAGIEVRKVFAPAFHCPLFFDNESNCAALAEMMWGAASGIEDFILFKVDLGVGGAIVVGGRVLTGIAGGAGEFGHMSIDPEGELCRCGNRGCLELYASFRKPVDWASRYFGRAMSMDDVVDLARSGDAECRRLIRETAEIAGRGLGMIGAVLNPGLIIIGGRVALAGDLLLEPLKASFERHTLVKSGEVPEAARTKIIVGRFTENDSCMGAVGLVLKHQGRLV